MAASVGSAIELHGISCDHIKQRLEGLNKSQIKEIVDKYPEITTKEYSYKTALEVAIENTDVDAVSCLLDYGADPDKTFSNKSTPLYSAVTKGRIDIVKLLMEKGADASIGPKYGDTPDGQYFDTPLTNACKQGRADIVIELLKGDEVRESINTPLFNNLDYNTALTIAILNVNESIVDALRKEGAELLPNEKSYTQEDFQDIFTTACLKKELHMVKMLLEQFEYIKGQFNTSVDEIDVNYKSTHFNSGLYYAASVPDNFDMVRYLYEKAARLEPPNGSYKGEYKALQNLYRKEGKDIPESYMEFLKPEETPYQSNINAPSKTGPIRRGYRPPRPLGMPRKSRRRNTRKNRKTRKLRKLRKG